MQIVIDIPERTYRRIQALDSNNYFEHDICGFSMRRIANGTPLPKGHGALKDFQKMYADMKEIEELARQRVIDTPTNSPCYMRYVAVLNERTAFKEMLYDAPTIIEEDKESEEV